jgi:Tol biopolymer transport system component
VDREASRADWSPNGNRLAFELFELSDGEHAGLAIMKADGSDLVDLTPTGINTEPAWTPDGKQLVYECFTCVGGDGIFVINDDGTGSRRLTNNPFPDGFDTDPNVSPDGKTVTFVRVRKDGREQALFAVDLDGGNARKLTSFGLQVGVKHDWAPDGRHIVITRDADYPHGRSPNVATIRPDGSQLRMLTTYEDGKRGAFAGSYSPDGRWIVLRVENLERQTFRLLKIRPDGSERILIATLPFAPRNIDWGSK